MKIKYNVKPIKWPLTIVILLLNFTLFGSDDIIFLITVGISVNLTAAACFILLSIFPRRFYLIDKDGISCQKANGKEIWYLARQDIVEANYDYFWFVPLGAVFIYREKAERKPIALHIPYGQFEDVKNLLDLK